MIDDHGLGPKDGAFRIEHRLTIALDGATQHFLSQHIHDVVGDVAALVVALIQHHCLFIDLGVKVTIEVGVACPAGVGHVNVGDLAPGKLIDFTAIALDPIDVAQAVFRSDGHHGHIACAAAIWLGADTDHCLLAGKPVEGAIQIVRRVKFAAIHRQEVFPFRNIGSG